MGLDNIVRRYVTVGRFAVTDAAGRTRRYGDGTGPDIAVRLKPGTVLKLALNTELAFGECYMNGDLVLEAGDPYDLVDLIARNMAITPHAPGAMMRLLTAVKRRLEQVNNRWAARRNVSHHYDLSHDLYRRFLDSDLQYSCAYYSHAGATLEEAQAAKKAHIAAKLKLETAGRILDIGCGWGGLGLALGDFAPQAEILGVTLSTEQLSVARDRARTRGVSERIRFDLRDYRDVEGRFDRIVSVGMFEHVGRPYYQAFFDTVARLLDDDGVALVHSIGRRTEPGVTQPFLAKYIFPGGYIPALSEVLPAIERAGLWITDLEVLRLHYAETIRDWRARFKAQRGEIAAIYDERFCRMWEFYLCISEVAFRWFGFMNFQIQLAKRQEAAPLTRDYITDTEQAWIAERPLARSAAAAE